MGRNGSFLATQHALTDEHRNRLSPLRLLSVQPQDTLHEVLAVLCQQEQPVLLILPEQGEVLSQPEHFLALQSLLAALPHPPLVHLVIPQTRSLLSVLAAYYGFPHSPSVEAALRVLLAQSPAGAPSRLQEEHLPAGMAPLEHHPHQPPEVPAGTFSGNAPCSHRPLFTSLLPQHRSPSCWQAWSGCSSCSVRL